MTAERAADVAAILAEANYTVVRTRIHEPAELLSVGRSYDRVVREDQTTWLAFRGQKQVAWMKRGNYGAAGGWGRGGAGARGEQGASEGQR